MTAPRDAVVEGTWEEFRQETNVFDSLFTELFLWLQNHNPTTREPRAIEIKNSRIVRSASTRVVLIGSVGLYDPPGTLTSLCLVYSCFNNHRNLHDLLNQTRIKAPVPYTNQPTYPMPMSMSQVQSCGLALAAESDMRCKDPVPRQATKGIAMTIPRPPIGDCCGMWNFTTERKATTLNLANTRAATIYF
jgi:hypothetical protein